MKKVFYTVKPGSDGVKRVFVQECQVKVDRERQARKVDIREALRIHRHQRQDLDDSILEALK